jgi:hypothetical protein
MRQVIFPCATTKWREQAEKAKTDGRALFIKTGGRLADIDRQLCCIQAAQQGAGYILAELTDNIYGFCVRDTMNDGGGRLSPNFKTALEVWEWARDWQAKDPERREVVLGYLDRDRRAE